MKIRRRVSTLRCSSVLAWSALGALSASACVADADPLTVPSAGSSGTGSTVVASSGSGGAGGASAQPSGTNSGGSAGSATEYTSDPGFGTGMPCPPVQQALLTDFTSPDGAVDAGMPATGASFGDFSSTFSGSTFVYPNEGAYAVHSEVSAGSWHLTGTLGNYSGFGITFNNCFRLDASAYKGVAFSVQGSVPMGNSITLNVGTAADDVTSVWLNRNAMPLPNPLLAPNAGRCVPAMAQYDGSCGAPSRAIPVTAQLTTVEVLWADLSGGRPAATVDPREITNISWNFPPPSGAGTSTPVTYDVDLTIDDLRFIE